MTEAKCRKCSKLLFKHDIQDGTVEIMCRHCKTMNTICIQAINADSSYANDLDKIYEITY